ncbi:MAG TPA: sn-glycerol-3-phosphate ABC transporter ATP-binding protein UgpC [Devosiaceae bacterium]|jgi:multiple sugar transport system ATP-binding protein
MASVELVNLSKSYGSVGVIHDISLTIGDGEFVALVGPSGCGKSTLLRMISGLETITDGDILFDGAPVNDLSPKARNVAMVFQSYALYPHMTVAENIGFNLKVAGVAETERKRRVEEAARMLNLEPLLGRRPSQLSGGQRQRVAMGRAVVRDPAVFLFDEPLSNLDAKLRVQMRSEIKSLHQKVRTTAIYVTHDQIEAMTLADRIVVLNRGRIEQQGSPMELYTNPANAFVAGFIGSPAMNFLDADAIATEQGPAARFSDGQILPLGDRRNIEAGRPLTIGIRPEHIHLAAQNADLSGQVELVEPTGAQTHVVIQMGAVSMVASIDGSTPIQVGSPFHAAIRPADLFVFDQADGGRIRDR